MDFCLATISHSPQQQLELPLFISSFLKKVKWGCTFSGNSNFENAKHFFLCFLNLESGGGFG